MPTPEVHRLLIFDRMGLDRLQLALFVTWDTRSLGLVWAFNSIFGHIASSCLHMDVIMLGKHTERVNTAPAPQFEATEFNVIFSH